MKTSKEHTPPGGSSPESADQVEDETVAAIQDGTVVNASGYRDQLKRQYGLLGLAGIALTVDNAWIALGSSISVSIGACLKIAYETGQGNFMLILKFLVQQMVGLQVSYSASLSPFSTTASSGSALQKYVTRHFCSCGI